eukprot:scaffold23366_cov112-Isochrysis_galbana.AAC.12
MDAVLEGLAWDICMPYLDDIGIFSTGTDKRCIYRHLPRYTGAAARVAAVLGLCSALSAALFRRSAESSSSSLNVEAGCTSRGMVRVGVLPSCIGPLPSSSSSVGGLGLRALLGNGGGGTSNAERAARLKPPVEDNTLRGGPAGSGGRSGSSCASASDSPRDDRREPPRPLRSKEKPRRAEAPEPALG